MKITKYRSFRAFTVVSKPPWRLWNFSIIQEVSLPLPVSHQAARPLRLFGLPTNHSTDIIVDSLTSRAQDHACRILLPICSIGEGEGLSPTRKASGGDKEIRLTTFTSRHG